MPAYSPPSSDSRARSVGLGNRCSSLLARDPNMGQVMTDVERETEIERYFQLICNGSTEKEKREAFAEMARLIAARSPAQIERMERERGLR